MPRSLSDPLVMADPCGVTLLSGGNVALAPGSLAVAMRRLGERPRPREGVPFVAFSHGRSGLVGCRGVASTSGNAAVLREVETFGLPSGLPAFAEDFARFLTRPGRFAEAPVIEPGTSGARTLAEALFHSEARSA